MVAVAWAEWWRRACTQVDKRDAKGGGCQSAALSALCRGCCCAKVSGSTQRPGAASDCTPTTDPVIFLDGDLGGSSVLRYWRRRRRRRCPACAHRPRRGGSNKAAPCVSDGSALGTRARAQHSPLPTIGGDGLRWGYAATAARQRSQQQWRRRRRAQSPDGSTCRCAGRDHARPPR